MRFRSELEQLTEPEFVTSPHARKLSRAEIEALVSSGGITPIDQIPHCSRGSRESVPPRWGRGVHGYFGGH